jgi:heptosyltransferase II
MTLKTQMLKTVGKLWFSLIPKHPMPATPKKVILFTLTGIGDALMLTPAIRGLRKKYPNAQIDVMAYPSTYPIFADNPNLSNVFIGDKNFKTWKRIKNEHYDMAICYSMFSIPVFAYLCGIPYRRGIAYNGNGFALTEAFQYTPTEHNILFSNKAAGVTEDMHMEWGLQDVKMLSNPLVIVPDAGTNSIARKKQWSVMNWIELLNKLNKPITLLGTDKEMGEQISRWLMCPHTNLMGKTTIVEFGQIIKQAKFVICNDSAAMHIASTFKVPCIAIFGPTDERFLTPPGVKEIHSGVKCRPCFYNDDIIFGCKRQICLERITVQKVYDVVTAEFNTTCLNITTSI